MSAITYGPFTVGVDNVTPESSLPRGALRDAINVDFDMLGSASRRFGRGSRKHL